MSIKEQEEIISSLRSKLVKLEVGATTKERKILDKKKLWVKAREAGKTISDDALSPGHTSAPQE